MESKRNWFNTPVTAVLVNLILLAFLVIAVVGALVLIKVNKGAGSFERDTVTITGEGRVQAKPDIAQVTVSIISEGVEAAAVQEENIKQFNEVVKALKDEGIDEKDLQTISYNVNPRYKWEGGERIEVGFEVRQSLLVKIRDLEKAGDIIRAAGQNGVNSVSGLSFTVDDPEVYREEARRKALEQAQKKAEELAEITGIKLGKVISFSENSGGGYRGPIFRESFALDSAAVEAEPSFVAPDFEAGSEEIIIYATIIYEVK